jgi:hypothetical protein
VNIALRPGWHPAAHCARSPSPGPATKRVRPAMQPPPDSAASGPDAAVVACRPVAQGSTRPTSRRRRDQEPRLGSSAPGAPSSPTIHGRHAAQLADRRTRTRASPLIHLAQQLAAHTLSLVTRTRPRRHYLIEVNPQLRDRVHPGVNADAEGARRQLIDAPALTHCPPCRGHRDALAEHFASRQLEAVAWTTDLSALDHVICRAPSRIRTYDTGFRNATVRGPTGPTRPTAARPRNRLAASHTRSGRYFASRLMSRAAQQFGWQPPMVEGLVSESSPKYARRVKPE